MPARHRPISRRGTAARRIIRRIPGSRITSRTLISSPGSSRILTGGYQQNYRQQAPYSQGTPDIPPEYRPISMWGYFGYELLFSIPCVGFILLLIFSFGGTQNVNLKNFARSYFCLLIIAVVLFLVLAGITGGFAMFARW